MQATQLAELIKKSLPGANVSVQTDDQIHFTAVVVAEQFARLSLVKRQQLVYASIIDLLQSGEVHALSLKTYTPEQWLALKSN